MTDPTETHGVLDLPPVDLRDVLDELRRPLPAIVRTLDVREPMFTGPPAPPDDDQHVDHEHVPEPDRIIVPGIPSAEALGTPTLS